MALDTRTAAALTGGRPRTGQEPKLRIWVLRAFRFGGERVEPGQIVEMDRAFGRELIAAGKAEIAQEPPPPPSRATRANRKEDEDARE